MGWAKWPSVTKRYSNLHNENEQFFKVMVRIKPFLDNVWEFFDGGVFGGGMNYSAEKLLQERFSLDVGVVLSRKQMTRVYQPRSWGPKL